MRMNFKNTITQIKRLLGRKRSDPSVEHDVQNYLNYELTSDENDEVLVKVNYDGEEKTFTPQQIVAMLLQKVKSIIADAAANDAKAAGVAKDTESARNAGKSVANNMDLVIAVPPYYTNRMRQALLDACKIAKVNCLRLIHEPTAIALSYGIFKSAKREFSDDEDTKVMFIDAGHSTLTATVVSFKNGALKVLSTASDPTCGSRDIDHAIAKYFAQDFQQKTGLDPWNKTKARIKLMMQAERIKKTLSPYGVDKAPVNVECVMEDQDYFTTMDIDTFEKLAEPVANKVPPVIERALTVAGVSAKDLSNVEVVGGGSRPRIMKRKMAEALGMKINDKEGHELSTTLNQDEAIARGAGLQCAVLSPKFRVKPFDIDDCIPYPVRVSWDADPNEQGEVENYLDLFNPGDSLPATKRVTFKRWGSFNVYAQYLTERTPKQGMDFPEAQPTEIAQFQVEGVEKPADAGPDCQPPKIRVDIRCDLSGCIEAVKAEYLEEIMETVPAKEEKSSKSEEETPKETPAEKTEQQEGTPQETPKTQEEGDQEMGGQEQTEEQKKAESKEQTPASKGERKKKRVKRHEVPVRTQKLDGEGGLDEKALEQAIKAEIEMYEKDAEIKATQDMRNDLETYIYSMRSALQDKYVSYASNEESEQLQGQLTTAEDWLYGEGFDVSKEEYRNELNKLRKIGDPIENRKWEEENREAATNRLLSVIEQYKSVLASTEEKYAHLTDTDRDTLRAATKEAEEWLRNKQDEQSQKQRHYNPTLTVADIHDKTDRLHRECAPIQNKPKPAPPSNKNKKGDKKDDKKEEENKGEGANEDAKDVNMDETPETAQQNGDDATPAENSGGEQDTEMNQ